MLLNSYFSFTDSKQRSSTSSNSTQGTPKTPKSTIKQIKKVQNPSSSEEEVNESPRRTTRHGLFYYWTGYSNNLYLKGGHT